MSKMELACREIVDEIMRLERPTPEDVERLKMRALKRHGLERLPRNSDLIRVLRPGERELLLPLLRKKKVRSISGVVVVTVMVRPFPCPKPEPCIYCPGGPARGTPQSYTGLEPACMRGLQNDFDPYRQVRARVEQLRAVGHEVDKVELIILGGTFTALPVEYQRWFVKRCLDALNGVEATSLEEAKRIAETSARIRNSGITVETRPDRAKEPHADLMLDLGITRVEVGVQTLYDDVYALVKRGHTVKDVEECFRVLKDAGFKIVAHLMPGLPGSSPERDLEMFKMLFTDERFKPDAIKIYPTLVIKGTELYEMWRSGRYRPYELEEYVELIAGVKKMVPPWVRIQRIQRDIPATAIEAGPKKSNLRELVQARLAEEGARCRCIRCREVGHRMLKEGLEPDPEAIELVRYTEEASEGWDIFLSFEDTGKDILIGYVRLRIPSGRAHRPEVRGARSAIIRELHVYGPMAPVGTRRPGSWQHRGFGARLMAEAERVAQEEYDVEKMLVLSALGVKRYYARFGYRPDGPYVSKLLR